MEFKDIILKLRVSKNLSQAELAESLSISRSTVSMWELGTRLPSKEVYEQLADFFNVDIDYLYGRSSIQKKVHFDPDGNEMVYLDKESRLLQYFVKTHPEYKELFELLQNVDENDIDFIKATLLKFKKTN